MPSGGATRCHDKKAETRGRRQKGKIEDGKGKVEDEKERENGKARKTREGDLLALVASKQKFVPDTLTWPLPRLITHFCDGLPLQSLLHKCERQCRRGSRRKQSQKAASKGATYICTGVPFANTPPATVKHLFPFEPAREIVLGPVCKLGIVPEGQKLE